MTGLLRFLTVIGFPAITGAREILVSGPVAQFRHHLASPWWSGNAPIGQTLPSQISVYHKRMVPCAAEYAGAVLAQYCSGSKPRVAQIEPNIDLYADELVLHLEDLLPDADGEIVLFTAETANVSVIVAAETTDSGVADGHVTVGGIDVTGLPYCAFDNGITLYYPDDGPLSFAPDVS